MSYDPVRGTTGQLTRKQSAFPTAAAMGCALGHSILHAFASWKTTATAAAGQLS